MAMCPAAVDLSFKPTFYQFAYVSSECGEFVILDDIPTLTTASSPPGGFNMARDRIKVAPKDRRRPYRFRSERNSSSSSHLEDELESDATGSTTIKESTGNNEQQETAAMDDAKMGNMACGGDNEDNDEANESDLWEIISNKDEGDTDDVMLEETSDLMDQFSSDVESPDYKVTANDNKVQLIDKKDHRGEESDNSNVIVRENINESPLPVLEKMNDSNKKTEMPGKDEDIPKGTAGSPTEGTAGSPADNSPKQKYSKSNLQTVGSPAMKDSLNLNAKTMFETEKKTTLTNGNVNLKSEPRNEKAGSYLSPIHKPLSRTKTAPNDPCLMSDDISSENTNSAKDDIKTTSSHSSTTCKLGADDNDKSSVDVISKPFVGKSLLSTILMQGNSLHKPLSKSKSLGCGLKRDNTEKEPKCDVPSWIASANEKHKRHTVEEEEVGAQLQRKEVHESKELSRKSPPLPALKPKATLDKKRPLSRIPAPSKISSPAKASNQSKPHVSGIPNPSKPHVSVIPDQSKPHVIGIADQSKPRVSGIPNQSKPHVSGIPDQSKPHVSRIPNQSKPNVSGIPEQSKPHASGIPNQSKPNASGIPQKSPKISEQKSRNIQLPRSKSLTKKSASDCIACGNPAYLFERSEIDGQVVHKNCAKCSLCTSTRRIRFINRKLYCGIHSKNAK